MLTKTLVALSLAALAANVSAQACSTLTVTGTGAPGTSVVITLDGSSPGAYAALAIGDTAGTTTFNLGSMGSLTLGLAQPFIPVPMGITGLNGDASITIAVPTGATGVDLLGQGVTLGFTIPGPGGPGGPQLPTLTFCTSNVVSFHLGN